MAKVSTLTSNVRKLLDLNNSSDALISVSDIDALNLDEIIEGTLVNAARFIESNAPIHLVDGKVISSTSTTASSSQQSTTEEDSEGTDVDVPTLTSVDVDTVTNSHASVMANGMYKYTYALDGDFLKVLAFKMSDWVRQGDVIFGDSPQYAVQQSKYGLPGQPDAPVVAIVKTSSGLVLEAYSCDTDTATVTTALYLPIRKIESVTDNGETYDAITISSKLQSAIEYYSAYLTCLTYGNAGLASYMLQQAMTLAEIPTAVPQQTTNDNNE